MGTERAIARLPPRPRRRREPQDDRDEPTAVAPQTFRDLQHTAGNRAVVQLVQRAHTATVARPADASSPESTAITARAAAAPSYGALDDPSFNAERIAHDLLRAIDQEDHTVALVSKGFGYAEDVAQERRKIDAAKVIAALENLTASQVVEVKKRYLAFEHRTSLEEDLFGAGQSGRPSDLSPDQRARITVLLRGTKADPIPAELAGQLAGYPPAVAGQLRIALVEKADAAAAMQQFEADSIELHELLMGDLDDAQRERLMSLHRRSATEIAAVDAFYGQHYPGFDIVTLLNVRLSGLQRLRMNALREGNFPRADAYAIENRRRQIAELNSQADQDSGALGFALSVAGGPTAEYLRRQREKKKAELTGDIEGILDLNRREALADRNNAGRSAGSAVAERLGQVLGQSVGESGGTLGPELTKALGPEHGAIITAAADSWNTSGSSSLVQSAAADLAAMEKSGTTTAVKLVQMLTSFRELATHDVMAKVRDPAVPQAEKEAIAAQGESAVTRLSQQYIQQFQNEYNTLAGEDGRSYQKILDSADDADRTYLGDLENGGGRTSDLGELQHAMGQEDVAHVKSILHRQPNRKAVDALVEGYNQLGEGHDLRKELFGTDPSGEVSVGWAESVEKRRMTGGLVTDRDAAQIAEELGKPTAQELAGKESTTGPFGMTLAPGEAEVRWIAGGGRTEYDVTMMHRGLTGRAREVTGDPETERLLKLSNDQLAELQKKWQAGTDPVEKHHLLLEMRKIRATLTGDADAYEKDNERVLGEIRSALSFAVSIALAIAIPGAGAGLAAFLETTAINIAANVAANVVIKGDDYGWADLKGDLIGGALGAGGAKFGEELLGRVAMKIAGPATRATMEATEKVGIQTALTGVTDLAAAGEKVAIGAEEFEAKAAGREIAKVAAAEGEAGAGAAGRELAAGEGAVAGATGRELGVGGSVAGGRAVGGGAVGGGVVGAVGAAAGKTLAEVAARELGAFFGGIYGGKMAGGDFGLSIEEVLKALITTGVGKAAHHSSAPAHDEGTVPAAEPNAVVPEQESPRGTEDAARPAEPTARPVLEPARFLPEPVPAGPDVLGPRSPTEMLLDNGIPPRSAQGFQEVANDLNVIIKVRPTNTASLPVLEAGGVAKPELVKAKTVTRVDLLIGGPAGGEGKVGFFEPKMPSPQILEVLSPEARQQVTDRFGQRQEEFAHYSQHYGELAAEGLLRVQDGVLQIADPTTAATPDAPKGQFKDIGGDHDLFEITHPDGSALTDPQRILVVEQLRSMGMNVEHYDHVSWQRDSPGTYSAEADAKIRSHHESTEPLVAFVPKSQPREVFSGTEVTGPARTVGPDDPHRPASGAQVAEPGQVPAPDAPGRGGPGSVQIPGETDFSRVMPAEPGAPAGPRTHLEDLFTSGGGISPDHPTLQQAYDAYVARLRGRTPLEPMEWALRSTRGATSVYLETVLGTHWRAQRNARYPGNHPELMEGPTRAPTGGDWVEQRVAVDALVPAVDGAGDTYWTFPDLADGVVLVLPSGTRVWREPGTRMIWEEHPVSKSVSPQRSRTKGQDVLPPAVEMPADLQDTQLMHGAASPGLGFDSPYSIARGSREVNLAIENSGIERWVRQLRDHAAPGDQYVFTTGTRSEAGAMAERIYRVAVRRGGRLIELAAFRVSVPREALTAPVVEVVNVSGEAMAQFGAPEGVDIPQGLRGRLGHVTGAEARSPVAPELTGPLESAQRLGESLQDLDVRLRSRALDPADPGQVARTEASTAEIERTVAALDHAREVLQQASPSDPRLARLQEAVTGIRGHISSSRVRVDVVRLQQFRRTVRQLLRD